MKLECAVATDVGKRREKNEDNHLVNERIGLFVVADGMGGHVGGELASRLAVDTIGQVLQQLYDDPEMTLQSSEEIKPGDCKAWLRYAIQVANLKIFEEAVKNPGLRGMGTTTVAILFQDDKIFYANVGDSRIYRIRNKKIEQLSQDHSLVGEQMRAGMIAPEEVRGHRLKNIITRSVGFQAEVEVDIDSRSTKKGDLFILCSDGLSNPLSDKELLTIAENNLLQQVCQRYIDIANERGGEDNITVIVLKVVDEEITAK